MSAKYLTFLQFGSIIEVKSNNQPAKTGGKVMRNKHVQMSLLDTYKDVAASMEWVAA